MLRVTTLIRACVMHEAMLAMFHVCSEEKINHPQQTWCRRVAHAWCWPKPDLRAPLTSGSGPPIVRHWAQTHLPLEMAMKLVTSCVPCKHRQ
ncbi:hypothetical protein CEXT_339621 [Caerostris extrusa]|uniref:Integrase zinc-binding domain-containing protein n=1 Tax=Caerostris extrusa TaxID=172846 RepID=A0AAV4XN39_CAEEX|nr:hypothetical protein CEXT_339621 [Caerostris extrusa]